MAYAQKKGLVVDSNFIFGFPTETREIMFGGGGKKTLIRKCSTSSQSSQEFATKS